MSSENDALCLTQKGVDNIAKKLNAGDGATAQRLLNECSFARAKADPEQHKAWTDMHDQNKTTDQKWEAVSRDEKAVTRVTNDLWQSVIKAQEKVGGAQLCKLELTKDDAGNTKPAINDSATCHNPPFTIKY